MYSSQRAGLILMREGALQTLSAPPQQTLAALAFHAPLVGVHCGLLLGFALPVAPRLLRNRNIASYAHLAHGRQTRAAVIPLVGHDFAQALFVNFVLTLGGRRGGLFGHRKTGPRVGFLDRGCV